MHTARRKDERCILVISALDYWSMGDGKGGAALHRTLVGYAERGWAVVFLTANEMVHPPDAPHPRVHVVRFDAPRLRRWSQIPKLGFLVRVLWWGWFQLAAFLRARRFRTAVNLVYGYEIAGVPVAKLLSVLWRIPVVARFQGTVVGAAQSAHRLWRVRLWDHVLGLRLPVDLAIMTDDGTQGDRVLERLGVDRKRVRFWMNGVDWEPFTQAPSKHEVRLQLGMEAAYILLTVSRLVGWKRVDRSIRALPDLVAEVPDTVLLVVGDGPARSHLEQLAAELGVKEHVRFEGAVARTELPKYLAVADVFLSLYDLSNVGNPLLEAMMAGKCIVTLNNGDTGKHVRDNVNGVLLEPESLTLLPGVLSVLLRDVGRRKRLGMEACAYAKDHFWTWQERIDAEVDEVSRLLDLRSQGR